MSKYKQRIDKLKSKGKTVEEIAKELGCAPSTVSYHLYPTVREQTKAKAAELKKKYPFLKQYWNFSDRRRGFDLTGKYNSKYKRQKSPPAFSVNELMAKLHDSPFCYLTGEPIDLNHPENYALDHILPISQGGTNTLDNLGFCLREINTAKAAKTPAQFFELCKRVLKHNGFTVC